MLYTIQTAIIIRTACEKLFIALVEIKTVYFSEKYAKRYVEFIKTKFEMQNPHAQLVMTIVLNLPLSN